MKIGKGAAYFRGFFQIGFFPHYCNADLYKMLQGKRLTPDQALQKARHFCGYQERCHQEVKNKLFSFGLNRQEVDNLIATLIEEDYLNEERFAIQFAGGKFRMKGWGRSRIKNELQQRQVSEYCIKKAMKEIPETVYRETIEKMARNRWETLKGEDKLSRLRKTQDHLLYKGYEWDLIKEVMKVLQSGLASGE